MRARIAAHARWKRVPDRSAATEPARAALYQRFADEIDPDRALDPADLAKAVKNAVSEYMTRLAFKSSKARSRPSTVGGGVDAA